MISSRCDSKDAPCTVWLLVVILWVIWQRERDAGLYAQTAVALLSFPDRILMKNSATFSLYAGAGAVDGTQPGRTTCGTNQMYSMR